MSLFYIQTLTQNGLLVSTIVILVFGFVFYLLHRQYMTIFYYYLHTVIITNQRIVDVDKSIFFRDSKDSVDLSKIQDIQKRQNGIPANIFNYGTLSIVLSGTHSEVNLTLVPKPDYYFKRINVVKQSIKQSGLPPSRAQDPTPKIEDLLQ